MAHRVCQLEGVSFATANVDSFFVQHARGLTLPQVSLDLTESIERPYQSVSRAGLATESDRRGEISVGIDQLILSPRTSGSFDEFQRRV